MVIYYNNKPVYLLELPANPGDLPGNLVIDADPNKIREALSRLDNELDSVTINGTDVKSVLNELRNATKHIPAAGGVVSKGNQILVIKRNGFWDLPKGKIEKNEEVITAAQREIEEECGVQVRIDHPLLNTYHFYHHKGEIVLKETFWFRATLISDATISPQLEEGITEVKWVTRADLDEIYSNTFSNIRDVLDRYFSADSGN